MVAVGGRREGGSFHSLREGPGLDVRLIRTLGAGLGGPSCPPSCPRATPSPPPRCTRMAAPALTPHHLYREPRHQGAQL